MKTILVVDDEPVIRSLAETSLRQGGWDVRLAPDAATALTVIQKCMPDLIFLDLGLPGLSGEDLARRLRTEATTSAIPIVYLTGRAPQDCRGADAVLTKPFTPDLIRAHAQNWL